MHDAEIRVRTKVDTSEFTKFQDKMEEADKRLAGFKTGLAKVGNVATGVFRNIIGFVGGLVSGLVKAIAKVVLFTGTLLLVRRAVKMAKEGFADLMESDTELGASMRELKGELDNLKYSLASAFAPIVQWAIPYIQKLVAWLQVALESVANFFAVLTGQDYYLRAKTNIGGVNGSLEETEEHLEDAKETLGELAGFDKLNVLNTQKSSGSGSGSGGSKGGSGGSGGSVEWEKVPVDKSKLEWLDKIKEKLDLIKTLVAIIGGLILGWKIGKSFGGGLETCVGLAIALAGLFALIVSILDQWENGITLENFAGALAGTIALAIGLGIAFGPVGVAIGLVVGLLAMMISAIHDIKKNGFTRENLMQLGTSVIGLLGPIWIFVGEILATFKIMVNFIKMFVNKLKEGKPLIQAWKETWDEVRAVLERVWNFISGIVKATFKYGGNINAVDVDNPANQNVPQMAMGGIVNSPTRAIIGEAGREAVLPLERNTEWMDALASRISQNMTVNIRLEGDTQKLFRAMQEQSRIYSRRTGTSSFA